MPALRKDSVLVTRFVRNLRGGSQPILAEASDGLLYVVKFMNNLQGPNLLFNESVGSELYNACRLAVPSWKPLKVTDYFLEKNRDCWIQAEMGCLRPTRNLCFGSRFVGGNDQRLAEILPKTDFKRVRNQASFWLAHLIDICAEHADNRQAVFLEDAEGLLDAYFIDHGHMFGGPKAELKKNFRVSRYLDSRIYPEISSEQLLGFQKTMRALDVDRLWQRAQAIPAEWRQSSSLGCFETCLQRLSNPILLQDVLETIIDDLKRRPETEPEDAERKREPSAEILRLELQGTEFGQRFVDHSACA
jgi:hypothetical protein